MATLPRHRVAVLADEVQRLRAEAARLADTPPHRQPVFYASDREQVVAGIPALRVDVGEVFPLLRFLVGDFRDRGPDRTRYGSYTVFGNRLDVVPPEGETVALALQVMVRGGLLVHPPAFTPFCPAEADYASDPAAALELRLAQSGQRWPRPMSSAVFPVSPAKLEIWGLPTPAAAPRTAPAALRGLGIALTFPGELELVAVPAWRGTFHQWERFVAADDTELPPTRGSGHEVFVPDDINVMKTVHARILAPPPLQ